MEINQLIAEFMGYEVISYKGFQTYNVNKFAKTTGELKNLWGGLDLQFTGSFVKDISHPFDTDFNYLLPVIRRIEEMGYVVHIAGIKYKIYKVLDESNLIISLVCGDLSKKTLMTCDLIVSFIKWYNENLKNIVV